MANLNVIPFPCETVPSAITKKQRARPRNIRICAEWGELVFIITPAGANILLGCLDFEKSHRIFPYHENTRAAQRLIKHCLVVETYDLASKNSGICLTPIGRAVAMKLEHGQDRPTSA